MDRGFFLYINSPFLHNDPLSLFPPRGKGCRRFNRNPIEWQSPSPLPCSAEAATRRRRGKAGKVVKLDMIRINPLYIHLILFIITCIFINFVAPKFLPVAGGTY